MFRKALLYKTLLLTLPLGALAACAQAESEQPQETPQETPQDRWWAALSSHCGKAFAGQLTSTDAADADMQGAQMVMHVRSCSATQILVPFHIKNTGADWNRSRTWVFTKSEQGLRLKHDHRHEDGTSDKVTMYGGDTADLGSMSLQSFPVDSDSIAMFKREGLDASITNIWSVGVDSQNFTYQLNRSQEKGAPEDRNFTVTFDLTKPITAPPAPWGHE